MSLKAQTNGSRTRKLRLPVILGILLCHGMCAFELSMVASRAPFGRNPLQGKNRAAANRRSRPAVADSVTSGLISQLAVGALKLRLKSQTHVSCDVTASSSDIIMRGQVGPVTVKGRGWGSKLGLTCRVIEATVNQCELDIGRALSNQKLVLTVPAEGQAMIALNEIDFGNFVTHPLMRPPGLPENVVDAEDRLEFVKDDVSIDARTGKVTFYGKYIDRLWQFTLERGTTEGKRAVVRVTHSGASGSDHIDVASVALQLTEVTSKFFNEMVFELDGTFLSFSDMMLTDKGKEPVIMLSLGILVKKFPSPGLEF
eukprot:scaffold6124_cov122-Cylindrotheca_fusiformis.AAC.38